ncbi:DUF4132 domain-containing protein [Kitasatospora sp. NPDC058162]|uniref:DUF4132 domain-containing protein n=1 Tax=Kitasatospora sp. NPDC058162 TaxID=3346362 RepID=UPI0036D798BF
MEDVNGMEKPLQQDAAAGEARELTDERQEDQHGDARPDGGKAGTSGGLPVVPDNQDNLPAGNVTEADLVRMWEQARDAADAGDLPEAVRLYAALAHDQALVLGPDARVTLIARAVHARYLGEAGDAAEAVRLYPALIADFTRVLGPDDRDTLITRANHAFNVAEAGDVPEAVRLYPALITDLTRALGPDHCDTLFTRANHARYTGEAGDAAEAVRLYPALIADLTRVLGPDDSETLIARAHHVRYTGEAGDAAEAARLYPALIADRTRVMGADHRGTLVARANHAYYVGKAGDLAEAVRLYPALIADLTRVLGADDRETLISRKNHARYVEQERNAAEAVRLREARDAARAREVQRMKELFRQHDDAARADELGALLWELMSRSPRHPEEWHEMRAELRRLTPEDRTALADACVILYRDGEADGKAPQSALNLVGLITCDLPGDWLLAERQKTLAEVSGRYTLWWPERDRHLVEAERKAGRPLAPELVAVFRRWALSESPATARELTEPALNVGEVWAEQALRDTRDSPDWHALLLHVTTATSAKPTPRWEQRARMLIDSLGTDRVRESVVPWLALVGRRTFELEPRGYGPDANNAYDPYNANALRGLVRVLGLLPAHPDAVRALGALVETSLRKVYGLGPRSPKVANAAVTVLSGIDGEPALAELARLATRVTFKGTLKLLDTALRTRAEALGLSREEIDELAVPAYGLTEVGRAERKVGEATAVLEVQCTKAVLGWRNAAGKAVKSVPAAVRRDHAEEVKELKAAVKDIDRMLSAHSERLERQFLARRTWAYPAWRERYLDHPLVGTLARRLLWTVDGTTVGFADGELRTLTDDPLRDGAEVRLWHPVGHEPAEIVAWRDWLERHAITQPFKQAHREVYLLTDAERTTGTYSNRFAAHVLRQHQFHSLAATRGWRNHLRLIQQYEVPPAIRELPEWGLRAEYWIRGDGNAGDGDINDSGSYLRLTTDQVRFYPLDAPKNEALAYSVDYTMVLPDGTEPVEPLPIAGVPPLVLSEVLRDVDLFVGVASVGNDPTWQDGGPEGRYREYWTSHSFGELNQTAETRRALLERLVPRLAIADRCTLEGRFLHVRGERHTYRIHLGSSNILRTPNDQYLCIVPKATSTAQAAPQTGYLPFEGDRMLAVILSKALMLAADTSITDPTILRQL